MKTKILTIVLICIFCFPVLTSLADSGSSGIRQYTAQEQNFRAEMAEVYNLTAESNDKLSNTNIPNINATITLSAPSSSDELLKYIIANNISVKYVTGRCMQGGQRVTFCADIGQLGLQSLNDIADMGGGEFIGFVSVQGYVNSSKIKAIEKDEHTLLLDTSYFGSSSKFPKDVTWEYEDSLKD